MSVPPELLGPFGALVLAFFVIAGLVRFLLALWKDHLRSDQDDRDERNRAQDLLAASIATNAEHARANQAMAAAWQRRNAQDAARQRRSDQ